MNEETPSKSWINLAALHCLWMETSLNLVDHGFICELYTKNFFRSCVVKSQDLSRARTLSIFLFSIPKSDTKLIQLSFLHWHLFYNSIKSRDGKSFDFNSRWKLVYQQSHNEFYFFQTTSSERWKLSNLLSAYWRWRDVNEDNTFFSTYFMQLIVIMCWVALSITSVDENS